MTAGAPELDMAGYQAWRFGAAYRDTAFAAAAAREVYRYYYRLRYPLDVDEWGRPKRLSPLHGRLQEQGAVFGTKSGWERADYLRPGRPWRRAGADQRRFGFTRPPEMDTIAEESRAFRERVGMIDMTSFGKLEVTGPGALPLLERAACNRIDRPVGSVVYTQLLNDRGGIAADVTVTRLDEDRFRVVTGAGAAATDLGRLQASRRDGDGPVRIRDQSDELAVVGIWGPAARGVLTKVTADDVGAAAFPFRTARPIAVAGADVLAQRITYVGELGFELYVDAESAVQVWDALFRAGRADGVRVCGYRVLDSLRIEKGYRYYGTDLTSGDTPFEAGLGFCVAMDKGDFIGREALAGLSGSAPSRRIRTLLVGDADYLTMYGGEAVHRDGEVISRIRSCAYGFTVSRNVAYAYLPGELRPGDEVSVEVLGDLVPATVAEDVLYDPGHTLVRS
jgi:4-methylaminobutanoate oxidase (formaldehyde-forming)